MYEIRVGILSEKLFKDTLKKRGGEKIRSFKFKDSYYIPINPSKEWQDGFFTMRLRHKEEALNLYFTKYEIVEIEKLPFIKNSNGKKIQILPNQSHETMYSFLSAIGFRKSISIERTFGEVWKVKIDEIQHLELTFEHIMSLGYTSEIELKKEDVKNQKMIQSIKYLLNEFNAVPFNKPLFGVCRGVV